MSKLSYKNLITKYLGNFGEDTRFGTLTLNNFSSCVDRSVVLVQKDQGSGRMEAATCPGKKDSSPKQHRKPRSHTSYGERAQGIREHNVAWAAPITGAVCLFGTKYISTQRSTSHVLALWVLLPAKCCLSQRMLHSTSCPPLLLQPYLLFTLAAEFTAQH